MSRSALPPRPACTVDFNASGRHFGYIAISHSDNRHAYGVIPVPVVMLSNGDGPTALITAGNHGDEHEGPVIIRRLLRYLSLERIRGRLILMPALNYPAVLADSRTSPLDGGNMNRAYPGVQGGTPTFAIADYVEHELLPLCDAALDLHSGGYASEFMPCAFLVQHGEPAFLARKLAAVEAFGAPVTTVVGATADSRSLSAAADRHGVCNMATELGGGGTIGVDALEIGYAGTLRWLHHVGLLDRADVAAPPATRFLRTRDRNDFVVATMDGLFEPCVRLGDEVEEGQVAGYLYAADDPERPGSEVRFNASGVVVCRRVPARTRRGDYLFHIGETIPADQIGG